MYIKDDIKRLTGSERAAIIFLCLGQARGSALLQKMDDREIYAVTHAMAGLGTVTNDLVERF